MDNQKIFTMGLHEMHDDGHVEIWRVPGGWIYKINLKGGGMIFVPFSREFQTTPPSELKGDLARGVLVPGE